MSVRLRAMSALPWVKTTTGARSSSVSAARNQATPLVPAGRWIDLFSHQGPGTEAGRVSAFRAVEPGKMMRSCIGTAMTTQATYSTSRTAKIRRSLVRRRCFGFSGFLSSLVSFIVNRRVSSSGYGHTPLPAAAAAEPDQTGDQVLVQVQHQELAQGRTVHVQQARKSVGRVYCPWRGRSRPHRASAW